MALFDKNFFEKHEDLLLTCANSKWLRWLLGVNRLPEAIRDNFFCRITPNSIHWVKHVKKDGTPVFGSAFFHGQRFAEALAFNLSPFVYFQSLRVPKWQFSPVGVLGMLLAAFVPKMGFLGFIGTTTSFYTGAGNGGVYVSTGAPSTWATEHARTSGDGKWTNPSSSDNYFQCYTTAGQFIIARNFYPADTSALTASASISAASLNYYWASSSNVDGVGNVVVETSQASTSTLANGDFDAIGSTDFGRKAWSSHSSGAMNSIDLNASGIAVISLTGTTKIGIINTLDFDNTAPTGNNYSATRYAAYTGTSSDPYYSITYTIATALFKDSKFIRQAVNRAATY